MSDTGTSTGDTEKKKDIIKRWLQPLIEIVYDFAENTTLNGLKYIAERRVSILERLFWISTFILSTVLCVIMVLKSYEKYNTSGVVVTLKEHLVSVNEYPFPAVTICPQARINQKRYNYSLHSLNRNFTRSSERPADELSKFHSAVLLCDNDEGISGVNSSLYPFLNYSVDINTFFEMAPKHEDIFVSCSWRNKVNCAKKFRPVLTADGVCHTFNILATQDIFRKSSIARKQKRHYLNTSTPQKGWSLEKNFYGSDNDSFPRRGRANGAREDLYIVLKEVIYRDIACDEQTRPGYKVYLHHPADLPQASLHNYAAQPGKMTSLSIKLDILETSDELSGYVPDIRQCYFPSERYLQFFQKYTSFNCQLECLANYTIKICGCVSFYMPRNDSTAICKADKRKCIDNALDKYAAEEDLNDSKISQCGCLPSCRDVNYDADVILTKLDFKEYQERMKEIMKYIKDQYYNGDYQESNQTQTDSIDKNIVNEIGTPSSTDSFNGKTSDGETEIEDFTKLTHIRIYYKRPRFVAMERSELIGLSQFLADVGGTLGLFLGFSFLTLAEIFYFFTLKLCCTFRRQLSAKKVDKSSDTNDV